MIPGLTEIEETSSTPSELNFSVLPPATTPSDRCNYNLWCDYHKEHGHTLSQYRGLKRILHQLAEEGKLERLLNRKEYGFVTMREGHTV